MERFAEKSLGEEKGDFGISVSVKEDEPTELIDQSVHYQTEFMYSGRVLSGVSRSWV